MTKLNVSIKKIAYNEGDNIIENVDFECHAGETISIIAPSGSGKTTLLRAISAIGLSKFKTIEGEVKLNGDIYSQFPANNEQKAKSKRGPSKSIQVVFQDHRLFPWLTIEDNLKFAAPKGRDPEEILKSIKLHDKKSDYIKNISGGQEARVSLGRTLISPPEVLLLDEPFASLDITTKDHIIRQIKDMRDREKEIVIIIVSHSIEDSIYISDTLYVYSSNKMSEIAKIKNNLKDNRADIDKIHELKKSIEKLLADNSLTE